MSRCPSTAIIALAALALGPAVQAQTVVRLMKPDAHFSEPFTQLTAIRELPNRKVLATDRQDKIVQLIDFASGAAVKVGREGQGPGEYAMPGALIPQPGGKTLLQDLLGRRYLEIDPDGKTGTTVPFPTTGAGPGGMIAMFGTQLADAQGRIYFQPPPFNPGSQAQPDSVPILRWDRARSAIDSVAWVGVPKSSVSTSGGRGQVAIRIGGGKVFEPQEAWGVAADGSVARVMPAPYRVIWYPATPGAPVAGAEIAWTPLKVTEADKQEVIEARKRMRPMMVAIGEGGRQRPPANAPPMPEPEFAETKPPFAGNSAVLVTAEGEVWVQKSQPAGAANPLYEVFDRSGKLVRKVTLNPRSRVVGFGEGTVYVARMDEDDLEYLERYARR